MLKNLVNFAVVGGWGPPFITINTRQDYGSGSDGDPRFGKKTLAIGLGAVSWMG